MSFNTFKSKATNLESNSSGLFVGAFFIPELLNENTLICQQKDDAQYLELAAGEAVSIPVIFEYYMVLLHIDLHHNLVIVIHPFHYLCLLPL